MLKVRTNTIDIMELGIWRPWNGKCIILSSRIKSMEGKIQAYKRKIQKENLRDEKQKDSFD